MRHQHNHDRLRSSTHQQWPLPTQPFQGCQPNAHLPCLATEKPDAVGAGPSATVALLLLQRLSLSAEGQQQKPVGGQLFPPDLMNFDLSFRNCTPL